MVAIIISITGSIVSGMVLFFLQRFFKKKAKISPFFEFFPFEKAPENMVGKNPTIFSKIGQNTRGDNHVFHKKVYSPQVKKIIPS